MRQLLEEFLQENPDRSMLERNGAILSGQRGLVHQMTLPPLTQDELIAVQDMADSTAGLPWPSGGGFGFRLVGGRDPNTPQGLTRGLLCKKPQALVERQQASQRGLHQHHTRRRPGVLEMDEWRDEEHAWGGSQWADGPEAQEARRQREAQKEAQKEARRELREQLQQRRAAERARVQQGQEERVLERLAREEQGEAQRAERAVALAERAAAAKERNPNPNPNPNPSPNPSSNLNPNPSPSPNQAEGGPWHVDEAGGEGYTAAVAAAARAARDKGSAPRRVLQKCSEVGLLLSQLGDEPTS